MPRYAVLFEHDEFVANWCWKEFNIFPMPVNMAIGILDTKNGAKLVGAIFFYWYNGCNIEMDYYGPGTPTLGIARILATVALKKFNVTRATLRTWCANDYVIRGMKKLGFVEEGTEKDFFGAGRNAQRMVIFRDGLIRLAGKGAI